MPNNCTPKFWSTCRVEGQVASLSGLSKNLVQAGYWDVEWEDSQYVTMCLKGIQGLHVEQDGHYRDG